MEQNSMPTMGSVGVEAAVAATQGGQEEQEAIEHPLYEKAIAALQGELDRRAEQARNDPELDDGAKHRKINALYSHAQDLRNEIAERYEKHLAEQAESHVQSLFYVTPINRDGVRAAYDNVFDRVSFLREEGLFQEAREELERFWTRALRTGDKPLEIAIGQIAIELGIDDLREAYLGLSAEKRQAFENYVTTAQQLAHFQNPTERAWGAITGGFALIPPPEARGS